MTEDKNSKNTFEFVFAYIEDKYNFKCKILSEEYCTFYIVDFNEIDLAIGYGRNTDDTDNNKENYELVQEMVEIIIYDIIDNTSIFDMDYSLGGVNVVEFQII